MTSLQTQSQTNGPTPQDPAPTDLPMELQQMLMQAAEQDTSDIHLDSGPEQPALRFRVDGNILLHRQLPDNDSALRLINQVRVAAGMDIDAIWSPEQGQFRWQRKDKSLDIRVTVAPTAPDNLALHLRLLRPPDQLQGLDELGLDDTDVKAIRQELKHPDGLVLVSGPTGAGKTTTLYAMLDSGLFEDKLVGTVEDPAEFDLPHVRQIEVDHRHDLTMAEGLRTLLRMDPDALAVGEIRDTASASTTAMAALAGRMVMATIHARDTAGAVTSLHRMGVPYYVIGNTLRLVINQQVVRRLCTRCAKQRPIEDNEAQTFKRHDVQPPEKLFDPTGCDQCYDRGYRGRIGVFEIVAPDNELRRWLAAGRRPGEIRQRIAEIGINPLAHDALQKVASGVTSLAEVYPLLGGAEDGDDAS